MNTELGTMEESYKDNCDNCKTDEERDEFSMNKTKTVQYAPLQQSTASDDEDEIVEFDTFPTGRNHASPGKQPQHIPLHKLGLTSSRSSSSRYPISRSSDVVGVAIRNRRSVSATRKCVITVLVCCGLVLLVGVAAVLGYLHHQFDSGLVLETQFSPYGDWSLFFNNSASESSVLLKDIDGDGLEDIVVGVTELEQYNKLHDLMSGSNLTMREACSKIEFDYPCLGEVFAIHGNNHSILWKTYLRSGVLFMNCDNIDVNADGKADCIFTGRESSVQAVDLATGQTHWVVDADDETWSSHFVHGSSPSNVYRALSVPDVDHDSIRDLLITHGGNQSKAPEDHDRASGRVILLSGASGKPLGRYLALPDNKETYMSPIRHVTANGSVYILFGSGGETIPGDLLIASYSDLVSYIMANGASTSPLRSLFSGASKGVMVAPVLADVTGDGTADILMSAFEGVLMLIDGETLEQKWTHLFPDMESYSTPCPGHYDDDGVLDFLILWGYGRWDVYDYATVYVISGKTGDVLWERKSRTMQMYSDISLKTTGSQDIFLVHTIGPPAANDSKTTNSANSERGSIKRRHIGGHSNEDEETENETAEGFAHRCEVMKQNYESTHLTCSSDLHLAEADTVVLNQKIANSPPVAYSVSPELYHYTLPGRKDGQHCHRASPYNHKEVDICVVKIPSALTAAVGDMDGNGEPELVVMTRLMLETITDTFSYTSSTGDLILSRVALGEHLDKLGLENEFLPMSKQPWRQFMGSSGDNVYRSKVGGDSVR